MFGSVFKHSVPERKMMQNGCICAPECILLGSETWVDFFATNACNLSNYTLEHVWECFSTFRSGNKNDAKRVHFGTRMHFFRVAKLGWIFSQRTHAIFLIIP